MPCVKPIIVKNSNGQPVPCGRCTQCRKRRASGWSFRLMQEEKISFNAQFITLTYGTSTVPITDKGYMSLKRRDVSEFIKRLRQAHKRRGKNTGSPAIRYYGVGEYGGKTGRPHYHLIIFNARTDLFQSNWGHGQIHFGTVTGASIGYTLKYISKPSEIPKHENDDREKEKAFMSKGIGKNYLDPQRGLTEWHKRDVKNRVYINVGDGKKASMPRYYKDKLYSEKERELIRQKGISDSIEVISYRVEHYGTDSIISGLQVNLENEKEQIQIPYKDTL